jgi:Protein of unknown function (DUF3800)
MICGGSLWEAFVDAFVPPGGLAVILSEVYFDESGTHDGSPVMTMAGYLFKKNQARLFSRDWQKALNRLGLPAAHMTDCANGNGNYAEMSLEQRILSEKLLIENIKRRTVFGIGLSVKPDMYAEVMGEYAQALSPYTLLLMLSVVKIRDWAERTAYQGKVAYFFESGHRHASEANRYMNGLATLGQDVIDYNYYFGHAFVDKHEALPLQAADMLAWLHRNYLLRQIIGIEEPRKDFVALARPKDFSVEVTPSHLARLREHMAAGRGVYDRLPEKLRRIYRLHAP